MFSVFSQLILDLLNYIHQFTGSYGWDIIILTAIARIVLLPLTFSGLRGMKAMQAAQPQIKALQEKYKDDKEKLNKEMMAFYKEVGFNPMSSCLPMILQLPIFIVLYRVLSLPELNGFILVNKSFYGMNLTSAAFTKLSPDFLKDVALVMPGMIDLSDLGISFFHNAYLYTPVLVVVALMTVTTVAQQMMMTVDPQQKSTMWIMNLFIVYISFVMPAGVLLYWGMSNVFQFAQQAVTKSPAADKLKAEKRSKKQTEEKKSKRGGSKDGKSAAELSADLDKRQGKKTQSSKKQASSGDSNNSGGGAGKSSSGGPASGGKSTSYPASKKSGKKKKKKRKKKK